MAYTAEYKLSVSEGSLSDAASALSDISHYVVDQEAGQLSLSYGEKSIAWKDQEADMVSLSLLHPEITFGITGSDTFYEAAWTYYYKNGKHLI